MFTSKSVEMSRPPLEDQFEGAGETKLDREKNEIKPLENRRKNLDGEKKRWRKCIEKLRIIMIKKKNSDKEAAAGGEHFTIFKKQLKEDLKGFELVKQIKETVMEVENYQSRVRKGRKKQQLEEDEKRCSAGENRN